MEGKGQGRGAVGTSRLGVAGGSSALCVRSDGVSVQPLAAAHSFMPVPFHPLPATHMRGLKMLTMRGANTAATVKVPYRVASEAFTSRLSEMSVDARFCAVLNAANKKRNPKDMWATARLWRVMPFPDMSTG